ncbi:MAG: hypothetical protein DHS20C16_19140 [Phycisphaerae bacterium]|nr:MAG: hypothetical protein DHS20C16_19140 [Phycisphaerae bacterium]
MKKRQLWSHAIIASMCAMAVPSIGFSAGPDVIVGEMPDVWHWTSSGAVSGMRAYSVATTSCNIGDEEFAWVENSNQHPVICQNMYRLSDGRIEQIGMSWLKHGFCALQGTVCGSCTPAGGGCADALGVGCSDPYGSNLNGSHSRLGPRFEVNPTTGNFPFPFSNPGGTSGNNIFKRIQVPESDLTTPGALYFIEGQYIHPEDAGEGNGNNNASYRRIDINGNFSITTQGSTEREKPAIQAWRDHGNGINTPDNSVVIDNIDLGRSDRIIAGAKVIDLGGGTWRYEYAVHNLNADRAAGGVSVPIIVGTVVTNVGFHDVDYHSGEPYDNTDWTSSVTSAAVSWNSPQTFAQNPNSNALRWGTMYNFYFDANVPPVEGDITIELFKPGTPSSATVKLLIPAGESPDCNDNTIDDPCDVSCAAPGCSGVVGCGQSSDCNANSVPDECEDDCDKNGQPDTCDIAATPSLDCNLNSVLDICEPDCDHDGIPDDCESDSVVAFSDDFETDTGWTVANDASLTTGAWERADPEETTRPAGIVQPGDDHTAAGTLCYVTQAAAGSQAGTFDVDGGPTVLTSPAIDASAGLATLDFWYWFYSETGDAMTLEASGNNGGDWTEVVIFSASASSWQQYSVLLDDYITPGSQTRFRLSVVDTGSASYTEAALDDVVVSTANCAGATGDYDGNGHVDLWDFAQFQLCNDGPAGNQCGAAFDYTVDGVVNGIDYSDWPSGMTGP